MPSPASRPAATRRVVATPSAAPPPAGPRLKPAWISGAWIGAQAALLTAVCTVIPAIAAFIATMGAATNAHNTWIDASGVGLRMWIWGNGGVFGDVTLVPLGASLVIAWLTSICMRRSTSATWIGYWVATATYAALVLGAAFLVRGGAPVAIVSLVRAGAGGLIVGGLGLLWGLRRNPSSPPWPQVAWIDRLPLWTMPALRTSLATSLGLFAAGSLLAATWIGVNSSRILSIGDALKPDLIGVGTLTLVQGGLLPDLGLWGTAYVLGPGFRVGQGTQFSVLGTTPGTMPAVPLLGAIPGPAPAWALALLAIPVLVGGVCGWRLAQRLTSWGSSFAAAGVAAGITGLAFLAAFGAASGGIGPGRMSEVGVSVLLCAGLVVAYAMVGYSVVILVVRGRVVERLQAWGGGSAHESDAAADEG